MSSTILDSRISHCKKRVKKKRRRKKKKEVGLSKVKPDTRDYLLYQGREQIRVHKRPYRSHKTVEPLHRFR